NQNLRTHTLDNKIQLLSRYVLLNFDFNNSLKYIAKSNVDINLCKTMQSFVHFLNPYSFILNLYHYNPKSNSDELDLGSIKISVGESAVEKLKAKYESLQQKAQIFDLLRNDGIDAVYKDIGIRYLQLIKNIVAQADLN